MTRLGIPLGTLIDNRYRIQGLLGRGAFGRTYLVSDDRRFGELCVLKEFRTSDRFDKFYVGKRRELFRREATILHQLDHPQIPKFLAWFENTHRLFLIQEYVDGQTYWDLLKTRRRLGYAFTEAEIVQWLRNLLPVLAYIHERNILHRDISPDNIMLPKGQSLPVLIDFGVVKQADSQLCSLAADTTEMSIQASVAVGKFGYSPNEQIRMGQCSPSSDLYSLAVTAIVLLTGKQPSQLIHSKTLAWNWHSQVEIDSRLTRILNRMMAEKPGDRYMSATAVLHDLARLDRPMHPIQRACESLDWPQWLRTSASSVLQVSSSTQAALNAHRRLQVPRQLRHRPAWRLALIALIGAGGIIGATRLSATPPFCQALETCIVSTDYGVLYVEAGKDGQSAQSLAESAETLSALISARDRLSQAIFSLSLIPQDADVYPQSQETLARFQALLNDLDVRIERETQAASLLNQAESAARSAHNLSQVAESARDYKAARDQWNAALTLLKAVPTDSFLMRQVRQKTQDYQAKMEAIEKLIAIEEPDEPIANLLPHTIAQPGSSPVLDDTSDVPKVVSSSSTVGRSPQPAPAIAARAPVASVEEPIVWPQTRRSANRSVAWAPAYHNPGRVALAATQYDSGVQIQLDGAYVNQSGTYVADLVIKNDSDRSFGFVPVLAFVHDPNGQEVQSRISLEADDEFVSPGETLRGRVFVLGRRWNDAGTQNLTLVLNEGTSGRRSFRIPF